MDTVFTLIMPKGDTPQATLIAKRGNYAHMDSFSYTQANVWMALQTALGELDLLERIPPQVEAPDIPPTTKPQDKGTTSKPPKKRKPSLADVPEDDADWSRVDTEEIPVAPISEPQQTPITQTFAAVQVGVCVNVPLGMGDVDGDLVPFSIGRILEIDHEAEPPRAWLESLDGEQDAWVSLVSLAHCSQA